MSSSELDPKTMQRINEWLNGPYDEKSKNEIRHLLTKDPKSLSDAFFKTLSFGTGGMRGIMGVGTNRMNIYTVRRATQGLANYLKTQFSQAPSVFIGYDVRHHSREFAEEAARVLAGNEITVYLSKEICPTPLVSFGVRFFNCQAGIMITASHNPPKYNGYKVYWDDGAQVVDPHDTGIIKKVNDVQDTVHLAHLHSPLIHWIGDELSDAYLRKIQSLQFYPNVNKSHLKIVYSPLHGTGMKVLPKALKAWGFSQVSFVEKQSTMDGNFSSAPSPNPEDLKALQMGTEQMMQTKSDLFIATDPDADRIGVVIAKNQVLSGNQVGCLLLDYICSSYQKKGGLPLHATFVKTIVTTELFKKIAENYGGICIDVLTGFKYIGEKIREWEGPSSSHNYIFGAEESCGYLFGSLVRDKDAISSACLLLEAAAIAKQENKTLLDRLYDLYRLHGVHRESLVQLNFSDSLEGMEKMQKLMERLRKNPPSHIQGQKIDRIEDYLKGKDGLPPSDVIRLWLKDETKLVIRPSGTEPKVKIYAGIVEKASENLDDQILKADQRLHFLVDAFHKTLLT